MRERSRYAVRGHSDWILTLLDEAHGFAASDQPRQAVSTMKHLAGSYIRVCASLEGDPVETRCGEPALLSAEELAERDRDLRV